MERTEKGDRLLADVLLEVAYDHGEAAEAVEVAILKNILRYSEDAESHFRLFRQSVGANEPVATGQANEVSRKLYRVKEFVRALIYLKEAGP